MSLVMRGASVVLLVSSVAGLYLCVRYAQADWLSLRFSEADRLHATEMAPADADVWLRLADIRTTNAEDEVTECLRRAEVCSPQRSVIWIQLGLEAEARKDYDEAERCLKQAVRLDRDFIPLWTLTNYYFRRADAHDFFALATQTLAWANGEFEPVFGMCWNLAPDSDQILQNVLPNRVEVIGAYLKWLCDQNHLDSAGPVARKLLDSYPQQSRAALLTYCDHLLASNRMTDAIALWNALSAKGLVRTGGVGVGLIANPDFRSEPVNAGFDWHVESSPGIQVIRANPGVSLSFSGSEADHCEILSQPVLVQPGCSYRLRYRLKKSGLEAGAGLRWVVSDALRQTLFPFSEQQFRISPSDFASTHSDAADYSFVVPRASTSDRALARVTLMYDREPAAARMEGWIKIEKVELERVK